MVTDNNSSTEGAAKTPKNEFGANIGEHKTKLNRSKTNIALSRIKRKILKYSKLLRMTLLGITIGGVVLIALFLFQIFKSTQIGFYSGLVYDFTFTPEEKMTIIDGRTNFLILGKGGEGHEAPDLTDTIIFASLDQQNSQISLISLPRDIWIPELRTKLNSAYYWGNQKENGGGLVLAKSSVEEIVGQPVSYALVLDFSGFKEIINVLGEIEVEVENSFQDSKYPIAGKENDLCGGDLEYNCRYETISFEKGLQPMDGEMALKFVRSRNAVGDEGTDIARAIRQEQVVAAMVKKILSREILTSPKKILELKRVGLESIETDISPSAGAILARRILGSRDNLKSRVLNEELLDNPPKSQRYDNLYVFIPKEVDETDPSGRNWSKVHEWVEDVLNN